MGGVAIIWYQIERFLKEDILDFTVKIHCRIQKCIVS